MAGVPPGADHVTVYGGTPPETVEVQFTVVPTVVDVGLQLIVTTSVGAVTVMLEEAVAVFALPSVAVTLILKVPGVVYVVVNVEPVPDDGLPPVATQLNV